MTREETAKLLAVMKAAWPRTKIEDPDAMVSAYALGLRNVDYDDAEQAVADCIEGRCQSRSSAATSACGDKKCSEAQYCEQFVGGPAGSEPSYTCRPLGDCQDCACLNVIGCGAGSPN